jgi:hypothetical protein
LGLGAAGLSGFALRGNHRSGAYRTAGRQAFRELASIRRQFVNFTTSAETWADEELPKKGRQL